MNLPVIHLDGTSSTLPVDKSVFGIEPDQPAVHQAVIAELTNSRQGTHGSKNKALVTGGGRKPWKQKGRGVARAGSIRSPLWRGGAKTFGPQPHAYVHKLPRKVRQLARRSVLSYKASQQEIIVVEAYNIAEPRTRHFSKFLADLQIEGRKITMLMAGFDENVYLAARNIVNLYICDAASASTYDLIDCDLILADKASISILNAQLTVKAS